MQTTQQLLITQSEDTDFSRNMSRVTFPGVHLNTFHLQMQVGVSHNVHSIMVPLMFTPCFIASLCIQIST